MITKKFIRNSIIYTIAGSLPMASATILIPLYVLYLPTSAYGALSLCLVFSTLVQILVTYSFDTSIYIHYHELKSDTKKLNSFISSAFVFMILLGVGVAILLGVLGQFIFSSVWPESNLSFYPYGAVSLGVGIFQAIFKVYGSQLQIREKPVQFLLTNIFSFILIVLITAWGLKIFPNTLVGPLGARLVAASLAAGWALLMVFREFGFHFQSPWRSTSFSFNAFTFVYQVQQWVINYFDRVLILFFMPVSAGGKLAAVGIYEFAVKCLAPVDLLLNGLNGSINPKVVKAIVLQEEKKSTIEINRYFYGLVSMIMLIICFAILFLPIAIDLFARHSAYKKALEFIPYLSLIFIMKAMRLYFVIPFTALKKMKELTMLNFFVTIFKLIAMYWCIVQWQMYGVILSSGLAYILEFIIYWYYIRVDYAVSFNLFKLILAPSLMAFLIIFGEYFFGQFELTLHIAFILSCGLLLWYAYRNEIRAVDPFKFIK